MNKHIIHPINHKLYLQKKLCRLIANIIYPFDKQKRRLYRKNFMDMLLTKKYKFIPKSNFDVRQIPIYLISYNRLSYLQQMIVQLERYELTNIHIIDNASTYPPLLKYLKRTPYKVYHMDKNYGHCVFWNSGKFDNVINNSLYVVSDPDIEFNKNLPQNFMTELYRLLGEYPFITKIGFALKINDLPDTPINKTVTCWEKRFWEKKLSDQQELYHADIDTTFALYRPGHLEPDTTFFYSAIRIGGNFTARHLPWYKNHNTTEEDIYYKASADPRFASWTNDIARYQHKIES